MSLKMILRALSQLMDLKAQATRYFTISHGRRMSWFTAFLRKYYLWGSHEVFVVVLVLMKMMNNMMMYILGVARFDENWCQVYIFCEVVCINPSTDKLVLHHGQLFVYSWCNTMIHFYNYVCPTDYVLYISFHLNCYFIKHLVGSDSLLGKLTTWATRLLYHGKDL
jgi:hypothetical protein